MNKKKFLTFLFLVLVWIPAAFAVYVFALSKLNLQGVINFVPCLFFIYAVLVTLILHSYWDEFEGLFKKSEQDSK